MDDSSVSSLVSLDNAVEAVAARVTPAVVNVAVTSKVSGDMTKAKVKNEATDKVTARDPAEWTRRIYLLVCVSSFLDKAGKV